MKPFLAKLSLGVFLMSATWGVLSACVTEEPTADRSKGPPYGKVLIKGVGLNEKNLASSACADFKVTEDQVRKIFQTYHRVSRKEIQAKYQWSPCYSEGLIETPKAVYSWRVRAGNTLETTYPDGKDVLMAGIPSR